MTRNVAYETCAATAFDEASIIADVHALTLPADAAGQRFDVAVFSGVVRRDADPCAAFRKPAAQ